MMKRFARTAFAAAGLSLAVSAFAGGYGAKHIFCGWDIGRATPDIILKHADRFDRLAIDGIAFYVDAEQDGERLDGGWIMNNPAWRYETFAPLVPTYRKIVAHRSLRESFLCCGMSARKPESGRKGRPEGGAPRIGLDDDVAWTRIAGNYRVLAKLAKAGGLRGLLFDNEDYHGLHQFELRDGDGDWESACAKMRARGRQVFRGIFEEYPDVRLLFFWAFSNGRSQSMQSDPLAALRESKRLFPAFLNGMLDVIPPTAVFIDGDEDSYVFRAADGAFEKNAVQILSGVLPYVAPENRAKYRAQVRNSYGLYLDQYVGSKYRIRAGKRGQPNNWYRPPVNGSRDAGFREDSKILTWLCAIAGNLFADECRKRSRSAELTEEIVSGDDFTKEVADSDLSFRVHVVLHSLEEPYKEVFGLRVFGELSFSAIGALFGKTETWARVTYHRARLKIQERMDHQ